MGEFADRIAKGFSQGQKVKTALARAIVHRPRNVLLDEPTNGLDVMAVRTLRRLLGGCVTKATACCSRVTSCRKWRHCATRSSSSPTARSWPAARPEELRAADRREHSGGCVRDADRYRRGARHETGAPSSRVSSRSSARTCAIAAPSSPLLIGPAVRTGAVQRGTVR